MKILIADGDRLVKILKDRKTTQIKLSQMTGISPAGINRFCKSIHMNTEDIKTICNVFDMEIWEFFIEKKDLAAMCKVSTEMLEISQAIEQLPSDIQIIILNAFDAFIDALLRVARPQKRR